MKKILVMNFAVDKYKLETQLKMLIHVVCEKQVGKKDVTKIISSLNASQKLLVPNVLKLVKLLLKVPTTKSLSVGDRVQHYKELQLTCHHLLLKNI